MEIKGFRCLIMDGLFSAMSSSAMTTLFISRTCSKRSKQLNFGKAAVYAFASLLLIAGALPSCSTAAGFGRDVEKVGDDIQDAAH